MDLELENLDFFHLSDKTLINSVNFFVPYVFKSVEMLIINLPHMFLVRIKLNYVCEGFCDYHLTLNRCFRFFLPE